MRTKRLVAVAIASALLVGLPSYALADDVGSNTAATTAPAAPTTAGGSDPATGDPTGVPDPAQAKETLAAVEATFTPEPAATGTEQQSPSLDADGDATMLLRDLARSLPALSKADRARAQRYLARPTDGFNDPVGFGYFTDEQPRICSAHLCVHYVSTTFDRATRAWAEKTLAVMGHVWRTEVARGGYHAPLSDADSGGHNGGNPNARLDVYLADVGGAGLYGYCTSDDPDRSHSRRVSAYCVLDNDYARSQFPRHTPLQNLQVTAAHEFFHAVQFSYDWLEDLWLMEGTAAWVEDEVYDSVNDNLQYIRAIAAGDPLHNPAVPLDKFNNSYPDYGAWVFWKELGEHFSRTEGTGMPTILRNVWHDAMGRSYSTKAVAKALARRHSSFGSFFTRWGVGNRFPARSYSEGRAHSYPRSPLTKSFHLSRHHRHLGGRRLVLNHMSNRFVRLMPAPNLTGKSWRVRVHVDAPARARGSHATLTVYRRSGHIARVPIRLSRSGNGVKAVAFGRGSVRYVELTLTNAGTRFNHCSVQHPTSYSCGGRSLDDKLAFAFRAAVVR